MSPESHPVSQSTETAPEAVPQGFVSRLMGVYFSPGETFAEIGRTPRLLIPMLVLAVVSAVAVYVMIDRIGVERFLGQRIEQAVASGQITQQQAEQQLEGIRRAAPYIKVGFPLYGAVAGVVMALIFAGICKLVSMLMGFENEFKPVFAVSLYTLLAVSLLSSLIFILLLYLKPPEEIDLQNPVGSNLAALLAVAGVELPKFVKALASYVDLFYIWKVLLLAIGYAAVSRRLKTSTAITICGVIAAILAVVFSGFSTLFG